jgi:competence protein ComEA
MRITFIALSAVMAFAADGQDLPDGPGKPTVVKLCSNCHGLATVIGLRRTKSAWETTVDEMVSRGMAGTDEELDAVVLYLTKYLGKVNVNKATAEEIREIAGLSAADAEAIVRYRTANGSFGGIADLQKIPNIDAKSIELRKDRIAFR